MNTTDDLRAALGYPSRPTAVDTGAILRRARRQRAARRTVAGTGLAMVALGVVVAVVAAMSPMTGAPTEPDLRGGAPYAALVAQSSALDTVAPARFDPLVRTLHVGWVPDGLVSQSAGVSLHEQQFSARDVSYGDGGKDFGLSVTVLAKGRPITELPTGALGLPTGEPVQRRADPVNGHPAVCISDPAVAGSCPALRWQYAPDAWAQVSYGTATATPAQAAAITRRVASSVSLRSGEKVRVPFTFTGVPARMRAGGSHVTIYKEGHFGLHGERWSASIDLIDSDRDLTMSGGERVLTIESLLKPGDPAGRTERDALLTSNITVDGHPAHLSADRRTIVVWGISETRTAVLFSNRPGNARTIYEDVHVLAHPEDPTDWKPAR